MQISSLHYGDYVSNGIGGSDIAMVEGKLLGEDLTVPGAQPVHACREHWTRVGLVALATPYPSTPRP